MVRCPSVAPPPGALHGKWHESVQALLLLARGEPREADRRCSSADALLRQFHRVEGFLAGAKRLHADDPTVSERPQLRPVALESHTTASASGLLVEDNDHAVSRVNELRCLKRVVPRTSPSSAANAMRASRPISTSGRRSAGTPGCRERRTRRAVRRTLRRFAFHDAPTDVFLRHRPRSISRRPRNLLSTRMRFLLPHKCGTIRSECLAGLDRQVGTSLRSFARGVRSSRSGLRRAAAEAAWLVSSHHLRSRAYFRYLTDALAGVERHGGDGSRSHRGSACGPIARAAAVARRPRQGADGVAVEGFGGGQRRPQHAMRGVQACPTEKALVSTVASFPAASSAAR